MVVEKPAKGRCRRVVLMTRDKPEELGVGPIGATGVMRLVTLLHEMKRRGSRYGLKTICDGGGLGIAAVLER